MGRPPLVLIPEHFGSLIFDRRSSRYLPFDHETTALLRRSIAQPVDALIEEVEGEQRAARIDFVEYFEQLGFFRVDGRLAAVALEAEPPADHLLGPLAVHLEIIAACNLRCTHCFAGPLPRKTELTLAEMDRLFGELAALGSYRLGLTGGEPLLRKDLLEILDAATGHGLHPCLTTNGLLIDERVAREIGRRELVWLNVSLEGATARSNDRVRGLGTFTEVKRRLRLLAEHARFTLAFTITADNVEEVEACAALAREVGAHTAVFRPLYPVGVARDRLDMMPSFAGYRDALARLSKTAPDDARLRGIDPFSPQARSDTAARTHANPGCGAANLVASVSATGEVNPCSFLGSEFDGGNLRERSFAEIWHASHVFQRLRERSGKACGEGFAGGCRARSLAYHGDVDAPDPWHDEWLQTRSGLAPLTNVHVERSEPRR
ncbi:MAG TPA: radical SAM protein [Enhygromyxa sp.]|nr:radical SAM protein [Enhygromyxa sp.]